MSSDSCLCSHFYPACREVEQGLCQTAHGCVRPSGAVRSAEPHSDPAVQAVPSGDAVGPVLLQPRALSLAGPPRATSQQRVSVAPMMPLSKIRKCPQLAWMPFEPSVLILHSLFIRFLPEEGTPVSQPDLVPKIQTHSSMWVSKIGSSQNLVFLLSPWLFPSWLVKNVTSKCGWRPWISQPLPPSQTLPSTPRATKWESYCFHNVPPAASFLPASSQPNPGHHYSWPYFSATQRRPNARGCWLDLPRGHLWWDELPVQKQRLLPVQWPPLSAELKTDPEVLSIMATDSQFKPPVPSMLQLNSVTSCSMKQGAGTLSHPFSGLLPLSYCTLLLECVSPEISLVKAQPFLQRPAPATPTFGDFLDMLPHLPTEQNTPTLTPALPFRLCDISPSMYLSLPSWWLSCVFPLLPTLLIKDRVYFGLFSSLSYAWHGVFHGGYSVHAFYGAKMIPMLKKNEVAGMTCFTLFMNHQRIS